MPGQLGARAGRCGPFGGLTATPVSAGHRRRDRRGTLGDLDGHLVLRAEHHAQVLAEWFEDLPRLGGPALGEQQQ
jgi:hypothetical protein